MIKRLRILTLSLALAGVFLSGAVNAQDFGLKTDFSKVEYGNIPGEWRDVVARKPSRNWMVDGEQFLRPVLKGKAALIALEGKVPADVELSATFKKTEDEGVFFGLAGRVTDSLNFYAARVLSDNRFQIIKVTEGETTVLTEMVFIRRYRYPEIWELSLSTAGSMISAVVRDQEGHVMAEASAKDEDHAAGSAGLYCTEFAAAKQFVCSAGGNAASPASKKAKSAKLIAPAGAAYTGDELIRPAGDPGSLNTRFQDVQASYDIIVAGAGTGGWAAAVQAARMGRKVLLLEESDWIGGQMAAAAVTSMDEAGPQVRERGIYRQFHESMVLYYYTLDKDPFQAYYHGRSTQDQQEGGYEPAMARAMLYGFIEDARRSENGGKLDLALRTRVSDVTLNGQQVTGVTISYWDDNGKTRTKQVSCEILVDATEHGDVIPLTGAPYRVGNTKSEQLDLQGAVQDFTYTGVIREYPDGIPEHLRMTVKPPEYEQYSRTYANKTSYGDWGLHRGRRMYRVALAWRGMADTESPMTGRLTGLRHTLADLNGGNDYDVSVATIETPAQRLVTEREGIYRTLSIVYYLQNELGVNWSFAEDQGYNTPYNRMMMKKRGLTEEMLPFARYLPQMPYVRESRRIIGVKTLVADDLERGVNARHFTTSVAMGDYYMDLHHTYEALEFDLDRSDFTQDNGPFQIPFEVFIPAKLDGFLPAEKNFSQSRLVSGATRLQPITMLTGQAVGVMASLAVNLGVQPRDLDPLAVQLGLLDEGSTLIQRWYEDVPWNSELWKAVQVLCLYNIMDRPGAIASKDGMAFSAPEIWGADRPISEKEAADGIRKLAALLGYTDTAHTGGSFHGSSLTGARLHELAGQISPHLARSVRPRPSGKSVTQKDFALFSLDCIRKVYR